MLSFQNKSTSVYGNKLSDIRSRSDTATREKDEKNQRVTSKKYASFTDYISEINNAQVDNAKYLHVVMPLCNLVEYSKTYSQISGSIW